MTDISLEDRVAIVTGAGGGLGREYALALANRGAAVVVNDLRRGGDDSPGSAAETVVEEIRLAGGTAIADHRSVADPSGAEALVRGATDALGGIDIVVNNAGIVRDRAFHNLSAEDTEAVLDVHLRGSFNVTQAAWPTFRDQRRGRVLLTTSAAGLLGNFGQANYAAAKAGLVGLMRVLAIEGARYGITAHALAPIARTQMTENVLSPAFIDRVHPKLVAPLVVWLSSDECSDTGNIYSVGGGRVARFVLALNEGWTRKDGELTPEDVRDHWPQINDTDTLSLPKELNDDFRALKRALG